MTKVLVNTISNKFTLSAMHPFMDFGMRNKEEIQTYYQNKHAQIVEKCEIQSKLIEGNVEIREPTKKHRDSDCSVNALVP